MTTRVIVSKYYEDFALEFTTDVEDFIPAQVIGPPENCYPAEGGEVEIVEVVIFTVDSDRITIPDKFIEKFDLQEKFQTIAEELVANADVTISEPESYNSDDDLSDPDFGANPQSRG